jgi:peptidoglycan DL-endopeptidase CwlO
MPSRLLRVVRRRVLAILLAICVLSIAPVAHAASKSGGSSASKRKEAQRIEDQLDRLYDEMSALAEDANAAQLRLATAEGDVRTAKAAAAETGATYDHTLEVVQGTVRRRYVEGEAGSINLGSSLSDNARRNVYLSVAQGRALDSIDALVAAKQDVDRDRAKATKAAKRAASEKKLAKDSLAKAQRLADKQEALLKSVQSDVARLLVVEEKQRLAAEAKAAAAAETRRKAAAAKELERRRQEQAKADSAARQQAQAQAKSTSKSSKPKTPKLSDKVAPSPQADAPADAASGSSNPGDVRALSDKELAAAAGQAPAVPASSGASAAIARAKAQLGKPYVWGAQGESYYDCSGLIVFSWKAAGKNLPHSSRALYAATQRVSQDQLQPGDLLFFGSPIHHVAMYIGNGEMIEAPHRGALVRIRPSGRRDYVGAGRIG